VISAAGERLDLIELPEAPHNLAFGGDDSRDLYVTALTSVYRLRTDVPAINPHTERSTRFHHLVYAAATGLAYELIDGRA
jgi:hypothetical protein